MGMAHGALIPGLSAKSDLIFPTQCPVLISFLMGLKCCFYGHKNCQSHPMYKKFIQN